MKQKHHMELDDISREALEKPITTWLFTREG